ncbi:MAG: hypothetical protein GF317_03645 [Candidatus Lokiarchaeota archaeon]|nr:hypothetical protein [Candidatus Lokiarchaeota archaeon]MBD3198981.1 hypothetical protein [Candidatus Lokiarchaeota archaeon]
MEIEKYHGSSGNSHKNSKIHDSNIEVKAHITCPNCGYNKTFKNKFHRKDIEMMIVSLKVFDWLACNNCGELLKLNLDFLI